jgi:putative DNA primase/helicase
MTTEAEIWNENPELRRLEPQSSQVKSCIPDKDEALLAELAALPPLEYDRRRQAEAERLGIRVSTLDAEVEKRRPPSPPDAGAVDKFGWTVEPFGVAVDTADLLAELTAFITHHVILPKDADIAVALWLLHAWTHDSAEISPLLTFVSPEMRCGKTTALRIVLALSPRPLPASNITAAAVFRSIEAWTPTLVVDEADTFMGESEELRGVINSGHGRETAFVVRVVETKDGMEPARFSTWCAKAIAKIGKPAPTLTDRSIIVEMERKKPGDKVAKLRRDDQTANVLRCKLARWAADNGKNLVGKEPRLPETLNDRAADNWTHLTAIADLAGGPWPEQARTAALVLSGGDTADVESTRGQLLADIRDLFQSRSAERLPSEDIAAHLVGMEGRPWPEWGKTGKPMSKNQFARQLAHFKITSRNIKMEDGRVPKGYYRADFLEAFGRYLPPLDSPSQPLPRYHLDKSSTSGEFPFATENRGSKSANITRPAPDAGCSGVADREGGDPRDTYVVDGEAEL